MSAPDDEPRKEARRHRVPLWGMAVVVAAVLIGLVVYLGGVFSQSTPEGGDAVIHEDEAAPTIDN